MRAVLILPFLLFLGCAPTVDPALQADLAARPHVTLGGGHGFSGGSVTSIYDTDQVLVISWSPGGEDRRETLIQLAPGTYGRIRAAALAGAEIIEPFEGPVCLDYGTDYVRVLEAGGVVVAEATAPCPHDPLLALQANLRASLGAP